MPQQKRCRGSEGKKECRHKTDQPMLLVSRGLSSLLATHILGAHADWNWRQKNCVATLSQRGSSLCLSVILPFSYAVQRCLQLLPLRNSTYICNCEPRATRDYCERVCRGSSASHTCSNALPAWVCTISPQQYTRRHCSVVQEIKGCVHTKWG